MPLSKSNTLSQKNAPVALDNLLTMPLLKYSHATTMVPQSKPIWTHLPDRDNIFAVFDLVSSKGLSNDLDQHNVLKVVRGGELMESIDLDHLQQQVRKDEECAGFMKIQDADCLVSILVKAPLVAIRYQLPNGQVQRMQMKFVRESDYTVTVGLLQRLELPVRDPKPSSRPQTALSISSSNTQQRPASARVQHQDWPSASQRGGVSAPSDHNITARSSSAMLESSPHFASSQMFGLAKRSPILHRSTSMFDSGSHNELPIPVRPFSSSTILDTGSNPQHGPRIVAVADLYSGTYLNPPPTIPETPLKTSSIAKRSLAVGGGFGSPVAQAKLSAMPRRALFEEYLAGKPCSPIAGIDTEDKIDHLLPPKRELPFAKLQSKPPSRDRRDALLTLPVSSSLDPISIESIAPARVGINKPAKAQTSTVKGKAKHPSSAAVEPTFFSSDPPDNPVSIYEPSNAPTSSMYNTPNFPRLSPSSGYAVGNRTTTSLVPTGDNQTNPGQPQAPTAPITNLVVNEVSDKYFARSNALVQKYHDRPIAETYSDGVAAEEAAFAALPEAERLAIIDAAFGELDGDKNFLQLCEDVEKSRKRILLGF